MIPGSSLRDDQRLFKQGTNNAVPVRRRSRCIQLQEVEAIGEKYKKRVAFT